MRVLEKMPAFFFRLLFCFHLHASCRKFHNAIFPRQVEVYGWKMK